MSRSVLLVDDHPLVRHGLAVLLITQPWVGAVHEASTIAEGARLAVLERPDVAVVDVGLPDGNGIELVATLARTTPDCRTLVLTLDHDPDLVRDALTAGARGYLVKETEPDAVLTAVRAVADGGVVLGPSVSPAPFARPALSAFPPPWDQLTPAEIAVAGGLGAGWSTPRIAAALGVSDKTVRNRVSTILSAVGAADRVELALRAREARLPTPR